MIRTNSFASAVGTTLIGAAALFSHPAAAGSDVAWSVSVGGPGFAVTAGQPYYGGAGQYGAPYRPYYGPRYRPVVVAPVPAYRPWYGPVTYYAPPVVYAPRYVAPRYYAPRPYPVAVRPYAGPGYRY